MEIKTFSLGNHRIGPEAPPLVIAELSGNHNGSLERALKIVDLIIEAGAPAVKLQTYLPETMTIDSKRPEFLIADKSSPWKDRYLFELYQEAFTPWEWHKPIMDRCREKGVLCFSTPFDSTAVDFLEDLKVPCYKVASFEMTDHPLIRKIAKTRKPVIMSTGMATLAEIAESVQVARDAGIRELVLLKCTSSYPADPSDSHIVGIPALRENFGLAVGLSDHTLGIGVALAAVGLGAVAIEKHVTLSRDDGGVDSAFSLEPSELRSLVTESQRAWQALGKTQFGPSEREKKSLMFRRSLFAVKDLQPGDLLTKENVRVIRPGHGLAPKHLESVLGLRAPRKIERGTPLTWDLLKS